MNLDSCKNYFKGKSKQLAVAWTVAGTVILSAWFLWAEVLQNADKRNSETLHWSAPEIVEVQNQTRESFIVRFLDVWQWDATYIQHCEKWESWNDCFEILIDAWVSGKRIRQVLEINWITDVDLLVASHKDRDHIWWIPYILQNLTVENIWRNWNDKKKWTQIIWKFFDAIETEEEVESAKVIIPRSWETFSFNWLDIKVCNDLDESWDANHSSLVLLIQYKDFSLLVMWDAEIPNFQEIYSHCWYTDIDALRVWHHWSEISLNDEFIQKFNPELAVISVWARNRYDHPRPEPVAILQKQKIPTYMTDDNWTISIYYWEWDKYKVETEK